MRVYSRAYALHFARGHLYCFCWGGDLPLASVRLSGVIPKDRIFDVMAEIRKVEVTAPVHEGDVVIADVLGLGVDVIVTKDVEAA